MLLPGRFHQQNCQTAFGRIKYWWVKTCCRNNNENTDIISTKILYSSCTETRAHIRIFSAKSITFYSLFTLYIHTIHFIKITQNGMMCLKLPKIKQNPTKIFLNAGFVWQGSGTPGVYLGIIIIHCFSVKSQTGLIKNSCIFLIYTKLKRTA